MRRLLDQQDSLPFRAGQLVEAKLRDVLGRDLPGSFRLPVEILDLVSDIATWQREQRDLLPHLDAIRPPPAVAATELSVAIECGAVEICFVSRVDSFAPLFVVEQHGGKLRLIFDLRRLNATLNPADFDSNNIFCESVYDVPSFLESARATVASKLDFTKAYWQCPAADSLARHMGVRLADGRTGRWTVLPFGLAHAPRLFQTITNAFVARWRRAGISVLGYLDDLLIAATDERTHARHVMTVVKDLRAAGIRISSKKAYLAPYTSIEFLGILFDIPNRRISISTDRLQRIADDASSILDDGNPTARDILALLGRIQFASFPFPLLTFFRSSFLADCRGLDMSERVSLSEDSISDLTWWRDESVRILRDRWTSWRAPPVLRLRASYLRRRGRELDDSLVPDIVAVQSTDASESGVGFTLPSGAMEAEPLPEWLHGAPSAARELWGVLRIVESSVLPSGSAIRVLCDNLSVKSSSFGRSVSPAVARVGQRLMLACFERGVYADVEWLPRELLASEDQASRYTDGSLSFARPDPEWLAAVWTEAWGASTPPGLVPLPGLELFATCADRVASSVPCLSRLPMPGSIGEALSWDWSSVNQGWAYPPFGLLRPILNRLTAAPSPPDILWLLPDLPLVRHRLAGRYAFRPGPSTVIAPSGASVAVTSPPLLLCIPTPSPPSSRSILPPPTSLPLGSAPAGAPTPLPTPSPLTTPPPGVVRPTVGAAHPPITASEVPSRQPAFTPAAPPPPPPSRHRPTVPDPPPLPSVASAAPAPPPAGAAAMAPASASSSSQQPPAPPMAPTRRRPPADAGHPTSDAGGRRAPSTAPHRPPPITSCDVGDRRPSAPSDPSPPTAATASPPLPTAASPPSRAPSVLVREVPGDMFSRDPDSHAMHCVSAHAEMGAGIAKDVANMCADDLPTIRRAARTLYHHDGSFTPGAVRSPLLPPSLWWVHLVTKERGSSLPSLCNVESALRQGFAVIRECPCASVVMPKIACGIDRLRWSDVRPAIERAATATPRPDGQPWTITVYTG